MHQVATNIARRFGSLRRGMSWTKHARPSRRDRHRKIVSVGFAVTRQTALSPWRGSPGCRWLFVSVGFRQWFRKAQARPSVTAGFSILSHGINSSQSGQLSGRVWRKKWRGGDGPLEEIFEHRGCSARSLFKRKHPASWDFISSNRRA